MGVVGVVELAQAALQQRLLDALRELRGLFAVAEPDQAEPRQPGAVDPCGAAPVAAQAEGVFAQREAGLVGRHGGRRGARPEPWREQMLLDQPSADLLRQVGKRQGRERAPGQRDSLRHGGPGLRPEQAA